MAGTPRVLIVDDDPLCRDVAVKTLTRLGIDAETASDGYEALEILARRPYDLVLMDRQMPGLDGLDVTRRLRQRGDLVPVVGFTSLDGDTDRARCAAAGMNDFLHKPLRLAELRAVIGRWLSGDAAPPVGA